MWRRSQSYRNQSTGFMNIHNSHPFYHFHPVRLLLQRTGSRTQTGNVWFHNASHEPLNSRSLKCALSTLVLVAAVVRRILTTRVTLGNIFLACPSLLLLLNLIFFLTLSFDLGECSKWTIPSLFYGLWYSSSQDLFEEVTSTSHSTPLVKIKANVFENSFLVFICKKQDIYVILDYIPK